jgi:hypothetical protein
MAPRRVELADLPFAQHCSVQRENTHAIAHLAESCEWNLFSRLTLFENI